MPLHVKVLGHALAIRRIVLPPGRTGPAAVHVLAVPVEPLGLDHGAEVVGQPLPSLGVAFVQNRAAPVVGQQPFGTILAQPGVRIAHAFRLEPEHELHAAGMRPLAQRPEAVRVLGGVDLPRAGVEPDHAGVLEGERVWTELHLRNLTTSATGSTESPSVLQLKSHVTCLHRNCREMSSMWIPSRWRWLCLFRPSG